MKKVINRGFTLIELLVVIAIIGILASIVLVSLNSARNKGKDTRVISDVNQARTQLEADASGGLFSDLTGTASVTTGTTAGTPAGPGVTNLGTLSTDASNNNGGTALTYNITTNGSGVAMSYSIYGKTSTGYFCVDSTGNNLTKSDGTNPPAAGAASAATCH